MNLSNRRTMNLCILFLISIVNLHANDGKLLFDLRDEQSNRISIHQAENGETQVQVVEEGEVLLVSKPLSGNLEISGLTVSPFRVWLLGKTMDSQTVSRTVPTIDLITNDGGSTTPPSGTPGGNDDDDDKTEDNGG